ncbi:hypothetical protein K3495_g10891 [Podosphaera aphanis]|nr:hypothetical protein K3495_g10891 [Podosphaera aphanis]
MSSQQNLYPPEGLKLENNLQIENALKQKFVATGDERYHEISNSFAHIRYALKIPIRDLTLKEEVMANGSIVKIPRKYLEQSVDVVDQLTNLGYKACNQLRDCSNNWVLRGLIKARIENLRKNGRRDKRKQKSSRDAKRMCRMAKPTNPRAIISATKQEKSQRVAAEKARKQDIERKRAQLAMEVPLVHTVECAPGFQWHINISNPFPTEHSEYTFECWKIKTPGGIS